MLDLVQWRTFLGLDSEKSVRWGTHPLGLDFESRSDGVPPLVWLFLTQVKRTILKKSVPRTVRLAVAHRSLNEVLTYVKLEIL